MCSKGECLLHTYKLFIYLTKIQLQKQKKKLTMVVYAAQLFKVLIYNSILEIKVEETI